MLKNEFCRSARIKDGLVLVNGLTENCVAIDEYSGKVWDKLNGEFTLEEIRNNFKELDNRINDNEINDFVEEMLVEGFLLEK